jgi:ABC-type branched-subunit amino acid transport system ATPase component
VSTGLTVKNIRVSYGGVQAVQGASIEVRPAACTAIIGANGAGKTSLLRGISGIVPARTDGIWLGDRRIDTLPPERRAKAGLGHVLENRHIFPGLSVRRNLELGQVALRGRDMSHGLKNVHDLFPDLLTMADVPAGSLSGGQQQFLAIARALMAEPVVLLLDEPTLGLAPQLVDRVADVVLALVAEGTTVVLVEQSLDVVMRAASEVHMLSHGQIVHSTTRMNDDLIAKAHQVYLS